MYDGVVLSVALLLLLSVFACKTCGKLGIPALLFFLIIGMVAASSGVDGDGLFGNVRANRFLATLALIFILFSGGLGTDYRRVRPHFVPALTLATAGVVLTTLFVGFAAMALLKLTVWEGLLFGAVVSSTDAAAVYAILDSKRPIKGNVRALLELEAGSNDPVAVFLTVTLTAFVTGGSLPVEFLGTYFLVQMGVGVLVGIVMACLAIATINRLKLDSPGLYPVFTVALALLCYSLSAVLSGSGFAAVFVLGLMMSRWPFAHRASLLRFHDGLAWLMQILMFLMLGLAVSPTTLMDVSYEGLILSAVLMFLARPLAVFACLAPFRRSFREMLLVSWVGMRGVVPIILALFPLLAGYDHAGLFLNIVFFIIITSTLVQGATIPLLARGLGLVEGEKSRRRPIELDTGEAMDTELVDVVIPADAFVVGKTIPEVAWPDGSLAILVLRHGRFLIPHSRTVILAGDTFFIFTSKGAIEEVRLVLTRTERVSEDALTTPA